MEVREPSAKYLGRRGYKQTVVGTIPENWDVRKLGEVASFRTGPFGSALHKSDYTNDGVPVINPMHIIGGSIVPNYKMTITESAATKLSEFRLKPNEIVIGRRGDMGRCAIVKQDHSGWLCGTGSMIVRPSSNFDAGFLQRVLSSPAVVSAIVDTSVGTTMINLNQTTLSGLVIQAPPLREQEAIAEALSDADALIESLEQLITKKCHIKQGAMQELLTGKKRLPGFSGEWEAQRFGDVVQLRKDRIDPRHTRSVGFCIELEHIEQGTGQLIGYTATSVSSSLKSLFQENDVLFGKLRAYLRKYWLASSKGVCSTEIWVLVAKHSLLTPQFLFQVVSTDRFIETASSSYGTHMPRSDWNVVKNFEVNLPTIDEQIAIATILSDMDAEITALEAKLAKARSVKQGMMQELLTGRIRLV